MSDARKKAEKKTEEVSSEELRDRLGEYLSRVEFGREEFEVVRRGKVAARLVPIETAA
jgi:prevent-host-death family protein